MSRPTCCRRVGMPALCTGFSPCGEGGSSAIVALTLDELEALRLADYRGLYQAEAAERMGISRATFGRIVESARRKVAMALVEGRALLIGGGTVEMQDERHFKCEACGKVFELAQGAGRPEKCPACNSTTFHRVEGECSKEGGSGRCCGGQGHQHQHQHAGGRCCGGRRQADSKA